MSSPVHTEMGVHSYNILVCHQASRPTTQTLGWMGHEYWLRSSSSAVVLEGNHWSGITLAMHYNCGPTHARTHARSAFSALTLLVGRQEGHPRL